MSNLQQLQCHIGYASVSGKRESNQDYCGIYEGNPSQRRLKGLVAAIADGVGGAKGGRQAAETAVRSFIDGYYSTPETISIEHAAGRILTAINRWILSQGAADPALEGMATTFSAVILRGHECHVIHVGDTRIYRLRSNRLQRLTTDHTRSHPDLRHVLYRAIGIEESLRVDHHVEQNDEHDRLLICSDGVHGVLSEKKLYKLLAERRSPQEEAERIVDTSFSSGSSDNITAIVIDIVSLPAREQSIIELSAEALPIKKIPDLGDEIDGYKLTGIIANNRYSAVFLGEDVKAHLPVVIKFPQPKVISDEAYRQAFVRESWVASRIRSPWVCKLIKPLSELQTQLYTVMPYYAGETLEERLLRPPKLTLDDGIAIAVKLAKAVYALNRLNIIHRDIKPENVLIHDKQNVKLLDLGVTRLPGIQGTDTNEIPGTPSYMAPELLAGQQGDVQSDVYALGVSLYRMFSAGHYPYGEIEPFSRPRFSRYTSLMHYRPDLPAWLDSVLLKVLEVDKQQRLGDAMELVFELEHGSSRGGQEIINKKSFYDRNPVLFWQIVSIALLLMLFASLAKF